MREIKFRAWDKRRRLMIGLDYPDNWGDEKDEWWADVDRMNLIGIEQAAKNENLILMQYTGLHDKNGKEIYESDLLKDGLGHVGEVVFVDGGFWAIHPNGDKYMPSERFREVAGNIYEKTVHLPR